MQVLQGKKSLQLKNKLVNSLYSCKKRKKKNTQVLVPQVTDEETEAQRV